MQLYLYFGLISSVILSECKLVEEVKILQNEKPQIGQNVTISCLAKEEPYWRHRKKTLKSDDKKWKIELKEENEGVLSTLHILNVTFHDSGKYKCIVNKEAESYEKTALIHVQTKPIIKSELNITGIAGRSVNISCFGYSAPAPNVLWFKDDTKLNDLNRFTINTVDKSFGHNSTLTIHNATVSDSGSYKCTMKNKYGIAVGMPYLVIQDIPNIYWVLYRSIGPMAVQLRWDYESNSLPVNESTVYLIGNTLEEKLVLDNPSNTELVLNISAKWKDASTEDSLQVYVEAANSIGSTTSDVVNITMLENSPLYTPRGSLKGSSQNSLNAGWDRPDDNVKSYIKNFILALRNKKTNETVEVVREASYSYMFGDLEPGTEYEFALRACMDVYENRSQDCGKESKPVSGKTVHAPPGSVSDILAHCQRNVTTGGFTIFVWWQPPQKNYEKVDRYKIQLSASALFVNEKGIRDHFLGQPQNYEVSAKERNYTIHSVLPNTNYTIRVSAGIGKAFSTPLSSNCETPIWKPRKHNLHWWKFRSGPRTVLKLATPHVSHRNGTVCCHRIIVVKMMKNKTIEDLPKPINIPILTHGAVNKKVIIGGYIAEAFTGSSFREDYLIVGDGKTAVESTRECVECLGMTLTPMASTKELSALASTPSLPYSNSLRRETKYKHIAEDKLLSQDANYTGFLILSVRDRNNSVLSSYSDYFNVIQPKPDPLHMRARPDSALSFGNFIYLVGAFLIVLVLIAVSLIFLLLYYHRRRKQLIDDGTDDSLSGSLGRIFRTLRRSHTLMSQPSLDVKPIPKDELVSQYLEKIKDSELGFRREFEALPEKFTDRSSRASEMTENSPKNRYPDIKAYDQTRVKLSSSEGSDYINANYVLGYKERKKFICAQGPMESTVNDFWRMIVEQRCSLCIMLTNLEETGKVKCVKYWPEAGEPKTFANITVRLVKEKPYADYLVRTLRAEWTTGTEPNGNIENGSVTTSSVNSNSNSSETKFHEVQQYHYLMWKDFVAPEHPVGILSFLRRINEAYSPDMGPLLIHCSAGVGRTGTLVALDSLVAEIDEENQASIYNLIYDLRHQRNFLVQSLKQYVFTHRALMEYAQFGNTESKINELKEIWKKNIEDSSHLQSEFERLGRVIEDRKAFTVANSDSNKAKNRYDFVLPYDTNCVILHPLPSQIGATYINASFMAGFDLGENFIVTQDPLENTIGDYWRMIYEQSVSTIVMLSELGSGEECCSKYWADEEETYEYVTVKFVSSESYPKFNTRTFTVTNNKTNDTINVTQFQYVGWSGPMGEVPVGTHGIMEVIARVQSHIDCTMESVSHTVVHCSGGGDRSSAYVCLNNCLRQLRREGCVDVFQTARKIRCQRQFQIQQFAQYEFVYKALIEYIDFKGSANL